MKKSVQFLNAATGSLVQLYPHQRPFYPSSRRFAVNNPPFRAQKILNSFSQTIC